MKEISPKDGQWQLDVLGTLMELIRRFPPDEKGEIDFNYAPTTALFREKGYWRCTLESNEFTYWFEQKSNPEVEEILRSICVLFDWKFGKVRTNESGEMEILE